MTSNDNERQSSRHVLKVNDTDVGQRLDSFICRHLDSVSRAIGRRWIETGLVHVHNNDVFADAEPTDEHTSHAWTDDGATHPPISHPHTDTPPSQPHTHTPASQPHTHTPPTHTPARQPHVGSGRAATPSRRLRAGEVVEVNAPAADDDSADVAEAIVLETVWCDEDLLVINKPAGLVVHPGAGNPQHTLMNALLHWWPELKQLPRAGIVHRLDRDTSGLMLVARSERALIHFQHAFKAHTVGRQYLAIVHGTPVAGGTVDAPLGRHATRRTQFDVSRSGRPAVTHYRLVSRFRDFTAISAFLQTGRTHQIRVHMRHIGYPVVGDPLYGGRRNLSTSLPPALHRLLTRTRRQMLHSWKISFDHPNTGQRHELSTPLPPDVRSRLRALHRYNGSA